MDFDDPTDHHDHNAEGVSGRLDKGDHKSSKNTNQHGLYIDLVKRVHELNERVEDIQIEQNAQRVSANLEI